MADTASRKHDEAHVPVLVTEVMQALDPQVGGRYLDGTLGLGGHSLALLQCVEAKGGAAQLCGLDRDIHALERAKVTLAPFGDKVHYFHTEYSEFEAALDALGWDKIDGALIDIGVSSMQIDQAERGFSFNADGPLDMRMNQDAHESAWHLVNRERFEVLKEHLQRLSEDPQAGRIARAIVEARQKKTIDTTAELANIVYNAYPPAWRAKSRNHPATRTFQALRMVVNDELGQLQRFLDAVLKRLKVGGRLAVICFHSLEDRMVKQSMRYWAESCRCPRHVLRCKCGHKPEVRIIHKKPVTASPEELQRNSRSSSAKLRAVEKIAEAH